MFSGLNALRIYNHNSHAVLYPTPCLAWCTLGKTCGWSLDTMFTTVREKVVQNILAPSQHMRTPATETGQGSMGIYSTSTNHAHSATKAEIAGAMTSQPLYIANFQLYLETRDTDGLRL